jgi:hypothetical protein
MVPGFFIIKYFVAPKRGRGWTNAQGKRGALIVGKARERPHLPDIPYVKVEDITEVVNKLVLLGGASDKKALAYAIGMQPKELNNPLIAAELFDFVTIEGERIKLTEVGHGFDRRGDEERRALFGKELLRIEPFDAIASALEKSDEMYGPSVLKLVRAKHVEARKWNKKLGNEMLKLMIDWGAYGKLLTFDSVSGKVRRSGGEDEDGSESVVAVEPVKRAETTREPAPTETSEATELEPEEAEPVEAVETTQTTAASEPS